MKRFQGGTTVSGGYYWSPAKWDIAAVQGDSGVLEGEPGERFIKVPIPAMLVIALVMGLGYVIFLPFIGFAMLLYAFGRMVVRAGDKVVHGAMSGVVSPTWRPGEAHFTGHHGEPGTPEAEGEEGEKSESLEGLKKEIDERRKTDGGNGKPPAKA